MKTSDIENNQAADRLTERVSVDPKLGSARNFWPYGVILAFALFITGTIGLIVLACSQKMDLVSSDYYEQEIKFQNQLDQLERASALSADASVIYDAATQSIRIALPTEHVRAGLTGNIQLYRPSSARLDRHLKLELDPAGVQRLSAAAFVPGLWKVRVSWSSGEKEYLFDQSVVIERPKLQTPISLKAPGGKVPNARAPTG